MASPQSPEWWRERLLKRYQHDVNERIRWAQLYSATQPAVEVLPTYQDAYRRLIRMARTPWPRLVVDIVAERLQVIGVTVGGAPDTSEMLWDTLRSSHVEMLQSQVHAEAINLGTSYVSVWDDGIAWESALTVTHELEPGDPHTVAAAIKVWEDTIRGEFRVNLMLPDGIFKWTSEKIPNNAVPEQRPQERLSTLIGGAKWTEVETIENNRGVVPFVPFVVRPDWAGYGRSDLDDLGPIFGRIENITTNIMLAIELGAFRQRWATGIDVPKDPVSGQPVEPFKVALDRLWVSEDDNAKFGSFEATEITGYLKAVSDAVGQLSAVSRIPVTYFVQTELANPPSAASLEASETGLINKVRERQETFTEGWEQVVAQVIAGDSSIPAESQIEPINIQWRDPRTRSESQTMDAAIKLQALGVPWENIMEFIGFTTLEIAAMKSRRMADTFERLLNAPIPQGPPLESTVASAALPPASPTGQPNEPAQ